ncbi:hypothetical protein PACTADRAFT_32263 [Pachysolen tannophilus NRRL Y-2460]|uniref:Uncharacterized protein n=1 Tax=Pachysolen tannophilus NRRL Y-2460 TaxID=669874 RepID=A0A1E4TYE1_PACTA|nr:hypothetical protein PACTADRAFT_32263 [Pachysolen tannophilus NRRL Y-2460]
MSNSAITTPVHRYSASNNSNNIGSHSPSPIPSSKYSFDGGNNNNNNEFNQNTTQRSPLYHPVSSPKPSTSSILKRPSMYVSTNASSWGEKEQKQQQQQAQAALALQSPASSIRAGSPAAFIKNSKRNESSLSAISSEQQIKELNSMIDDFKVDNGNGAGKDDGSPFKQGHRIKSASTSSPARINPPSIYQQPPSPIASRYNSNSPLGSNQNSPSAASRVAYSRRSSATIDADLNKLISVLRSKGQVLSPEDINELRELNKRPSHSRISEMSQYSGVVEEVQFREIVGDERTSGPALVEVRKSGVSSNGSYGEEDQFKKLNAENDVKIGNNNLGEFVKESPMDDTDSVLSSASVIPIGPLKTATPTATTTTKAGILTSNAATPSSKSLIATRAPDVSQVTRVEEAIPARSSRRPRSAIVLSQNNILIRDDPRANRHRSSKSTYSLAGTARSSPITTPTGVRRRSLPPSVAPPKLSDSIAAPLQVSQAPQPINTARLCSGAKPLPEAPLDDDDEDDDDVINNDTNDDDQGDDEFAITTGSENLDKLGSPQFTNDSSFGTTTAADSSVKGGKEENELDLSSYPVPNAVNQHDGIFEDIIPPAKILKEGGNISTSTVITDVASFHTADNASLKNLSNEEIKDKQEGQKKSDHKKSKKNRRSNTGKLHSIDNGNNKNKKKNSSITTVPSVSTFPYNLSNKNIAKLLEATDGGIIGEEFEKLDLPLDEKRYLEKLVDAVARLATDSMTDPERKEGTIERMKQALRILEGFE